MHIALEFHTPAASAAGPAEFTRLVTAAEAAGVALVTIADPPEEAYAIEAGVRAAYLSRLTARIGLAPTLQVTTTEPFHLATQLASLDHATRGRAGWVVGATNSATALATIGRQPLREPELRREIGDVIDVARLLWDSWQDDAVIKDVATGRFLDQDKVHHVNFTGASFSVTGPLITPRPPQGQVVVLGADTLGVTGKLDIALIDTTDPVELAARARQARAAGAPLIFAELDLRPDPSRPALPHEAASLPELLERLAPIVDGVRIHTATVPAGLPAPGTPAGATLRETLGLPRPVNQFATA